MISDFRGYQQKSFITDIRYGGNIPIDYILLYFMKGYRPLGKYDSLYKAVENIELHISFGLLGCNNLQDFTYGSFDIGFTNSKDTLVDSKSPKKIRDKAYKLKSKLCKEFPRAVIEVDTTIWNFDK
jgi:hypothetical protein